MTAVASLSAISVGCILNIFMILHKHHKFFNIHFESQAQIQSTVPQLAEVD
jgi:hypothetical protein